METAACRGLNAELREREPRIAASLMYLLRFLPESFTSFA